MKREEFFELLEEGELLPLTDQERKLAVELARRHTGRVVLAEWKDWVKQGGNGFSLFGSDLPSILRMKEERTDATETAKNKPFNDVTAVWKARADQDTHDPVIEEKSPGEDPWAYDDKEGWTINGFPAF